MAVCAAGVNVVLQGDYTSRVFGQHGTSPPPSASSISNASFICAFSSMVSVGGGAGAPEEQRIVLQ